MKLISLNTLGGKFFDSLSKFIKLHSENTDIFCFQEMFSTRSSFKQFPNYRANLLEEIINLLPNFDYFFAPVLKNLDIEGNPVNFPLEHGLALFVDKTIKVKDYKSYFIYKNRVVSVVKKDFSDIPINIQVFDLIINGDEYTICNFHGASFPGSKLDTPQRIEQSKKIKDILKDRQGNKIITGDFNLLPQTQSIKIVETDMQNLINEFDIKRTRSNLSPFFGKVEFQNFADFTFVSNSIFVKNFQVPEVEISDHLPMILEFS